MKHLTNRDIQEIVATYYSVSLEYILSSHRNAQIALIRQIGMFLVKKLTNTSYPNISRIFNRSDHTTAMHAVKQITKKIDEDLIMEKEINELILIIKNKKKDLNNQILKENNTSLNNLKTLPTNYLQLPIENMLRMSFRTFNSLKNSNILIMSELLEKKESYLIKIPNFGQKSLNEIKEQLLNYDLYLYTTLVSELAYNKNNYQNYKNSGTLEDRIYIKSHNDFNIELKDKDIENLLINISSIGFSIRTYNILNYKGYKKVGDMIGLSEDNLMKEPNCGKKSIDEIKNYLKIKNLSLSTSLINWNDKNINFFLYKLNKKKDFSNSSIEKELLILIQSLNLRQQDVLRKRYGLNNKPVLTLEDIGEEYKLTRERIRQIEAKALRILKTKYKDQILEVLIFFKLDLWNKISNNKDYIVSLQLFKDIKTYDSLILDLLFEGCTNFLNHFFYKIENFGWYRGELNVKDILDEVHKLVKLSKEYSKKFYFPISIGRFCQMNNFNKENLEITLHLCQRFIVYKNMLHQMPKSVRKIRSIRIFNILTKENKIQIMRAFDIFIEYKKLYNDDVVTPRDILWSLDEEKHIFICVYHNVYSAICENADIFYKFYNNNEYTLNNLKLDKEHVQISHEKQESLKNKVFQFVESNNAVFQKDVYNFLANIDKTAGSAGFILKYPEFTLLAPGFYGLTKNIEINILDQRIASKLLNKENCLHYIISRYAGDKINTYPLWNYKVEEYWCIWASNNASLELYESLLHISQPKNWDTDKSIKDNWIDNKQRFQKFHYERKIDKDISSYLPTMENVFRVIYFAKLYDNISFSLISRIGKSLWTNDWRSASILSILIKLDCVTPQNNWMSEHSSFNCKVNIDYWLNLFINKYIYSNQRDWNSELGTTVLEFCKNNNNISWVKNYNFNLMISSMKRVKK